MDSLSVNNACNSEQPAAGKVQVAYNDVSFVSLCSISMIILYLWSLVKLLRQDDRTCTKLHGQVQIAYVGVSFFMFSASFLTN